MKSCKKVAYKFYCKKCDYGCSNRYNFNKHLTTTKHLLETTGNAKETQKLQFNCTCGRTYKTRSGLFKHKKKCTYIVEKSNVSKVAKSEEVSSPKNDIEKIKLENENLKLKIQLEKEKNTFNANAVAAFVEQLPNLTNALTTIADNPRTINNTNNNNMTINMYLNQECKNAMNLTDFVENVKISLEDLMYTQQHGYVKGISNILVRKLKDMDPKKRPIHCSDKKRMQFYVKEEDKWEKDKQHTKIDNSIAKITHKQILKIREWEDQHPNFLEDDKLVHIWQKMCSESMGGSLDAVREKNCTNIKKQVSNIIEVKDAMKD